MDKNKEIIKREFHVSGLQIREKEEGNQSRTITGYAIVFNSPYVRYEDESDVLIETISPSAITREVLDQSDFVMTMFHDFQLVLARSKNGKGTLSYDIDDKGVSFEFEAPNTVDGDKALELVRRGDIDGCSFAFTTDFWDSSYVSESSEYVDKKKVTTYSINKVKGIYDFTLTPNPAYDETECSCRELVKMFRDRNNGDKEAEKIKEEAEKRAKNEEIKKQIAEMREAANRRY